MRQGMCLDHVLLTMSHPSSQLQGGLCGDACTLSSTRGFKCVVKKRTVMLSHHP